MIWGDLRAMERLTLAPLRLAPNRVYRTYRGGALLDRLLGKPDPEDTHFPEEWVVNTEYVSGEGRRCSFRRPRVTTATRRRRRRPSS